MVYVVAEYLFNSVEGCIILVNAIQGAASAFGYSVDIIAVDEHFVACTIVVDAVKTACAGSCYGVDGVPVDIKPVGIGVVVNAVDVPGRSTGEGTIPDDVVVNGNGAGSASATGYIVNTVDGA
jgi:hypothetical protein